MWEWVFHETQYRRFGFCSRGRMTFGIANNWWKCVTLVERLGGASFGPSLLLEVIS